MNKIYISESKIPNGGRGVFASKDIKTGELIETCPAIEIPKQELESLETSVLLNYVYFFGKGKTRALLALGFGSIYNHSYTPSAMYKINSKEKTIDFVALVDISKDEEIIVNYNQDELRAKPLWFEQ